MREQWANAARPILMTLDLGAGDTTGCGPMTVALKPQIADNGECEWVGEVRAQYAVAPGLRPSFAGRVKLTMAGSKKWKE